MERDPNLNSLRELPRFQELLAKLAQPSAAKARQPITPNLVQEGRAIVDETNTVWEPRSNTLIAAFKFTKTPMSPRVYDGDDRISRLLNLWYGRGEAAGNHGDLYDNRDDGHSLLSKELFPQISHIEYGADARAAGVHYGVNSQFLFNAITFGNSSTVMSGRLGRSQARLVLTTPELVALAYQHYANDHLYIFPEVRDHDPERGDLFPANTPYMIISQGSSGSDRPFMRAIGAILAAFRPDVKEYLRAKHLVAPTVQMIFRSGLKSVKSSQDYLSAKAHPSVFEAADIDLEKMIHLAQGLRANAVPPRVQIAVVKESKPKPGIDYFGPTADILFDTPSAIARIVRSTAHEKRLVISAATTTALEVDPGTRWKYANNDSLLLMRALRDRLGNDLDYLRFPYDKLLHPLGMYHTRMETDHLGNFIGSSQVYTTARDLARFGVLLVNDGVWNDERILPEGWVDFSRSPAPTRPVEKGKRGYGAQFWLLDQMPGVPAGTFTSSGNKGQYVTVLPDLDLVIVRTGVDPMPARFKQDQLVAAVIELL